MHESSGGSALSSIGGSPPISGPIWRTSRHLRSPPQFGPPNQRVGPRRPGHGLRLPNPAVQPPLVDDLPVSEGSSSTDIPPVHSQVMVVGKYMNIGL